MAKPIGVMIVDDSALIRNLVSKFFEDIPNIQVVGKALNGAFALKKLESLKPDLIILDLEMPEMNGIEFLKERKKRKIDIPVIILSSIAHKGARITMEALSLGAADFLLKPAATSTQDIRSTKHQLIQLIRIYGRRYQQKKQGPRTLRKQAPEEEGVQARRVVPQVERPPEPPEEVFPKRKPGPIEVIALGISTGGPNALRELLPQLDKDLRAPVLVVQHMPAGFTGEFAKSLDKICSLEIKEAKDGDVITHGRVFIAPGNRHMTILPKPLAKIIKLTDAPPLNGHRPSVDTLFAAVSRIYENRSLAIIMTGMGKDGAAEIGSIYREGGLTLAQDEISSIVFGMPKVAIERGFIHRVVPLERMAQVINEIIMKRA